MPLAETLKSHFGTERLRQVIIVPTKAAPDDTLDIVMKRTGRAAAVRLLRLLGVDKKEDKEEQASGGASPGHTKKIGLTYGKTLRSVVDAVKEMWPEGEERRMEWIPVFGDLLLPPEHEMADFECLSSTLAADLTRTTGGSFTYPIFLGTPAHVPPSFLTEDDKINEERIKLVKELVQAVPSYSMFKFFGLDILALKTGSESCLNFA